MKLFFAQFFCVFLPPLLNIFCFFRSIPFLSLTEPIFAWNERPFGTNTPKRCPFHYWGLECKSRKSRNTWSNRQIWPWNTEWSRAKANRILPREHTGHSKYPLSTTQEKTLHMDITRWSAPKSDWLYSLQPKMEKLYTVSKAGIQDTKKRKTIRINKTKSDSLGEKTFR